jgi:bifunctional DNA-binding transcriptional regulator/antitoxin component of YhaV-PrlF toxin-antitoxin module
MPNNPQKDLYTRIYLAKYHKSQSWKTTVPVEIAREFSIKSGDVLDWNVVKESISNLSLKRIMIDVIPAEIMKKDEDWSKLSKTEANYAAVIGLLPILKKWGAGIKDKRFQERLQDFLESAKHIEIPKGVEKYVK